MRAAGSPLLRRRGHGGEGVEESQLEKPSSDLFEKSVKPLDLPIGSARLKTRAEYWIVDRERKVVIVHGLVGGAYSVLGEYIGGQIAASGLLEGFAINVAALFAAAENIPE